MAVCIRLSRFGRLHRPLFRVIAIDKRCHREGMSSDIVGQYDPLKANKNLELDAAKVEGWVNRGAQISPGLRSLMHKYGYAVPAPAKAAAAAPTKAPAKADKKAKPAATAKKTYVKPTRRALRQHAAKLKAARKAEAAAAAASAAPAAEQPANG
jgi:small subunit ribosomal protein S16